MVLRRFRKLLTSLGNAAQAVRQLGNAQLSFMAKPEQTQLSNRQPVERLKKDTSEKRPLQLKIALLWLETEINIKTTKRTLIPKEQLPKQMVVGLFGKEFIIPLNHAPITLRPRLDKPASPTKLTLTLLTKQFSLPYKAQAVLTMMLVSLGIMGSIFFSLAMNKPAALTPPADTSAPIPAQVIQQPKPGLGRSRPLKLSIPSIGVETSFIKLGKNKDGGMEVPERYDIAGWYKYAPTPGEIGPAIIVGHVDNYRGPAVFFRLKELKRGAIVKIKRADGKTVKFKVNTIKQFYQNNFPTKKVYGNINYAGLRLITCGGQFNNQTLQYDQNTVVYASLVR